MDSPETGIALLIGLAISCAIGYHIGKIKGNAQVGALLGVLGPVGWIIAAILPQQGPKCPQCLGVIPIGAAKCLHCGSDIPQSAKVVCPYCETVGYVREVKPTDSVECANCHRSFLASGKPIMQPPIQPPTDSAHETGTRTIEMPPTETGRKPEA